MQSIERKEVNIKKNYTTTMISPSTFKMCIRDSPKGGQIDYVLGHFTDEDRKTMDERLETAGEIIKSFCLAGIDITMNQFNKK